MSTVLRSALLRIDEKTAKEIFRAGQSCATILNARVQRGLCNLIPQFVLYHRVSSKPECSLKGCSSGSCRALSVSDIPRRQPQFSAGDILALGTVASLRVVRYSPSNRTDQSSGLVPHNIVHYTASGLNGFLMI